MSNALTQEQALLIAKEVFSKANALVKQQTGESIIEAAFDIAMPALVKQAPALAIIMPIIKSMALPMIESALTADQYSQLSIAIDQVDEALGQITIAASAAQVKINSMSDAEFTAYLSAENLIRKDA